MRNNAPPAQDFLERVGPSEGPHDVYLQHLGRYCFAAEFVANRKVLDVACGTGYAAPLLCEAGARSYCGVDISGHAIELARKKHQSCQRIRFSLDDACRLSTVEDDTVDVAISFETIEHLEDPRSFLLNLRRVLKPEGTLIVSTPNRYLVSPRNNLFSKPANPFHVREWDQVEFLQLLGEFFEVRQVFGQHVYPLWKARILRTARRRTSVRRLLQGYDLAKQAWRHFAGSVRPPQTQIPVAVESLGCRQSPFYLVVVTSPRKPTPAAAAPRMVSASIA